MQPIRSLPFTSVRNALFGCAAVATAGLLWSGWAAAQVASCTQEEAKERFGRALVRLGGGDWKGACDEFAASLACQPRASTQVKIAECREHDGDIAGALRDYQRALPLGKNPATASALEAEIRSDIERLVARVPRVLISLSPVPKSATVTIDDRPLSAEEILDGARVNPGPHRIGASAPGYGTERVDIIVGEGQRPTVSVTLVAAPEPTETARPGSVSSTKPDASVSLPGPIMTPDAATPPSQSGSEPHGASPAQFAGMGLGAAGVAVLATAGYFALRTQALVHEAEKSCHTDGTCEQAGLDKLDEARTAQTTGLVLGGAGAALLGTGLVLVLAAGTRGSKGALFVAPSVGSFGLRAGGVF